MKRSGATMSDQGRITLPAAVRATLNLRPGDRLIFDQDDAGRIHVRAETGSHAGRYAGGHDLSRMPEIVKAAYAKPRPAVSDDPIGDFLVAEDERTKSGR